MDLLVRLYEIHIEVHTCYHLRVLPHSPLAAILANYPFKLDSELTRKYDALQTLFLQSILHNITLPSQSV